MKKLLSVGVAAACAGAMLLVACGGDDNNGSPSSTDGGATDGNSVVDSGATPGTDGAAGDAQPVDGGCNFAVFATDLIKNSTTSTALPSTFLGQGCTDDQNQADFKALFP